METRRKKKANQTQKARELVQNGKILSRPMIAELSKATARAYLSSMQAPVRGNLDELRARIRRISEVNGIDTFKCGDTIATIPPPLSTTQTSQVRFGIPRVPSVEDQETLD